MGKSGNLNRTFQEIEIMGFAYTSYQKTENTIVIAKLSLAKA